MNQNFCHISSLQLNCTFPVQDKKEMILHHLVTILLIYFSWACNFVRVGTLVLVVHDIADPWMAVSPQIGWRMYGCQSGGCQNGRSCIQPLFSGCRFSIFVWSGEGSSFFVYVCVCVRARAHMWAHLSVLELRALPSRTGWETCVWVDMVLCHSGCCSPSSGLLAFNWVESGNGDLQRFAQDLFRGMGNE